ncbi:MAG: SDR family NAD(P)-dependent oxidoreductase, partial [Spirochaetales bacterium]|nr:SDR family NAD(P)-dependent oxidoreductase [Spirochaetales bacterium]
VFRVSTTSTPDNLDLRFAVNTIAPYLLTKKLLPLLGNSGRVVNLSSAAQAPLNPQDLKGVSGQSDGMAYAQSKLALTMWTAAMAESLGYEGPMIVAVNPASMLGSKMVKEAYGVDGADLRIGADILCRAALSDEFADASGKYFDNDSGKFSSPHPDAMNAQKCAEVVSVIESVLDKFSN